MRIRNNKGQLTIFIIVAIVIVAAVVIFFVIINQKSFSKINDPTTITKEELDKINKEIYNQNGKILQ